MVILQIFSVLAWISVHACLVCPACRPRERLWCPGRGAALHALHTRVCSPSSRNPAPTSSLALYGSMDRPLRSGAAPPNPRPFGNLGVSGYGGLGGSSMGWCLPRGVPPTPTLSIHAFHTSGMAGPRAKHEPFRPSRMTAEHTLHYAQLTRTSRKL